jgi:acetylornithine deacetylase/succinyl-diaminopimelate desuccinylase-like protein
MARLADMLARLERQRLPVHITPPLRLMIEGLAGQIPAHLGMALRQLLNPALTNLVLKSAGEAGQVFAPLVRNTATPTMVRGGEQINVLPCEIQVGLDGRLLPGLTPQDLLDEVHAIVGDEVELVVERFDPCPPVLDMVLFPALAGILRQMDPEAHPIPLFLPAVTDARFFSRLGIQTYGFIPMNLAPDFKFTRLVHAADERIPIEALLFGTEAIYQALRSSV